MEKRDALLTPEQREKMKGLRAEHEADEAKEGKEGGHHWRHKKQQTTPPATTPSTVASLELTATDVWPVTAHPSGAAPSAPRRRR